MKGYCDMNDMNNGAPTAKQNVNVMTNHRYWIDFNDLMKWSFAVGFGLTAGIVCNIAIIVVAVKIIG